MAHVLLEDGEIPRGNTHGLGVSRKGHAKPGAGWLHCMDDDSLAHQEHPYVSAALKYTYTLI